jgi:hypothetical protein
MFSFSEQREKNIEKRQKIKEIEDGRSMDS